MKLAAALFCLALLSSFPPAFADSVDINGGNSVITIGGSGGVIINGSTVINGSTIIGGSPVVTGEGPAKAEDRKTDAYSSIRLEAPVNMTYTGAHDRHLSVSAPANILPLVTTTVEDGKLVVKMTGSAVLHEPIVVTASGPTPAEIVLPGAGSFHGTDFEGKHLRIVLSGSGSADVSGAVDHVDVLASGSGGADTAGIPAKEADVTVSGSGSVRAFASETAVVTDSGSGAVHVGGSPAKKSVDKTGSGDVSFE